MTVAIAILNWNGKKWLEKFLPSVIQYSQEAEIYVIDNASTDDSIQFLKSNFPEVKIVQNQNNSGFAAGYNQGLKSIKADIFCLLNSDVEVTENWIIPIKKLFSENQDIAAIQPKILDYNHKDKFEFAGAGGGMIDNLGYPYCRGRIFENIEFDNGQYNDETEIFWASGCSLFIRSEDFWNMNGFDERFFAHQEEIDLCWRLKNAGRKIYYTGKSTVYHVGGGTLKKENPVKTYLNFRNNLSMMLKNLPSSKVFFILFFRLHLDGYAAFYLAYKNGWRFLWAVLKAHVYFYIQLPKSIQLRQKHQIDPYYQTKWLMFKHFLGSKK
ncbi:glycosyltransferase family 2 protein [Epilithonimonas ginsengisoli]|uniref:Glycosyltransferase family 2 protein n=1 Tax=Epilithonimonas ginsengisoli TaxID=1245592 RepID=A0ABU4JJ91_9FLAO|nr:MULTISPECIES: glycosyltransferase family 2 protein [Chryseobacterium group]MBV6880797.1 glycosyltransferase family 2 protein [Epilithonimonas sp. FP105]MDW8549633.1 glycosyltransferase family 2 protein [Epilithonimonas ginsengisoli]OAH76761.1 glycosyl transferase family 2 [Chryseobacterium sp. FP211-J200]